MSHPNKGKSYEGTHERGYQDRKLKAAIRAKEAREREFLSKTSLKDIVH